MNRPLKPGMPSFYHDPEDGYRILGDDDILRLGDEYSSKGNDMWSPGGWIKFNPTDDPWYLNKKVSDVNWYLNFRRPFTSGEKALLSL